MNHTIAGIPYVAPGGSVGNYAARALHYLSALEQLDSRLLAYMLAPSNVLTLAGLRSFSPYNDKIPHTIDVKRFETLLASHGFLWLNESPNASNTDLASYALVNFDVVEHLYNVYPLEAIKTLGKVPERSSWAFLAWIGAFDVALARTIEDNVLSRQWLRDWWSPHNIRFGMLLGYPGAAIATFVHSESTKEGQNDLEEVVISKGLFNSADVTFVIDKTSRHRKDVATMIDVWRDTLAAVYMVCPEERLMADAEFARIVKSIN